MNCVPFTTESRHARLCTTRLPSAKGGHRTARPERMTSSLSPAYIAVVVRHGDTDVVALGVYIDPCVGCAHLDAGFPVAAGFDTSRGDIDDRFAISVLHIVTRNRRRSARDYKR